MSPSFSASRLRANWFYLVAAMVLAGDLTMLRFQGWHKAPSLLEAGLLFDFAVVLPLLYLWCYRANGKAAVLRALMLCGLGVWAVGHLVPPEHQHILGGLQWLRPVGMVLLALFEVKLLFTLYKSIFSGKITPEAIGEKFAADTGLPAWVGRLITLEARLWRKAAQLAKRLIGRP